jgi:hypothetical protein
LHISNEKLPIAPKELYYLDGNKTIYIRSVGDYFKYLTNQYKLENSDLHYFKQNIVTNDF